MKQPTKKNVKSPKKTADDQVALFETIYPLLSAAFDEVKEFSKKKQDELLNSKKVKIINRLLDNAKEVLKNELTVAFLDMLDEEDLPSNSDAVLTMSQYMSAMRKFRIDHYHIDSWDLEDGDWD